MKKDDEKMYTTKDVEKLCGVSQSKAANIIRALNRKLISEGTPKECVISGKISKIYFSRHMKL
ncbi:MAG: hypothetical protein ACRDBY_08100 [Cetobacterium sp.]